MKGSIIIFLVSTCNNMVFAQEQAESRFNIDSIARLTPGLNTEAFYSSTGCFYYPTPDKKRILLSSTAHAAFWAGSYIALNKVWYADYPRSGFHFFNDNREWNQQDKAGHLWTTYQVSRISGAVWKWTHLKPSTSAWLGGLSGMAYQSIIELNDAYSAEWGFSWGDMIANATGAAAYVSQELLWQQQRIQIKMSYWPYDYNSPELKTRRDQLFGKSLPEQLLKDYNSQTYWLSANLHDFFPQSRIPKWLNLAVGYNSDGLLGGFDNKWEDAEGMPHDRTDITRVRKWLLSADVDLTKIPTNSKFLRSVFYLVNMIKIPAPALSIDSKGKFRAHALYY